MNSLTEIAKLPTKYIKEFLLEIYGYKLDNPERFEVEVHDGPEYMDIKLVLSHTNIIVTVSYNKKEKFYDYFDNHMNHLTDERKSILENYKNKVRDEHLNTILS